MDKLRLEMQKVFRTVFGDSELELRDEMTATDVDGWDSLAHLNLMIAIEREFGIRFATAEMAGMKDEGRTVGDLLALVHRKKG
jgi:acyl carrier protein